MAYIFTKAGEDSSMKSRNEATAISKRNVCLRFQDAPISEVLNQALNSTIIASLFVILHDSNFDSLKKGVRIRMSPSNNPKGA